MEIAVVFESMFGATHEVADAIAEGVSEARPDATVTCLRVSDADVGTVARADLVIVGGPTHMRGMSSGVTRKMAVSMEQKKEQTDGGHVGHGLEPDATGPGLRDWFHTLPEAPKGKLAAAFDTRGEGAMMGGAAKGIAHRLESRRPPRCVRRRRRLRRERPEQYEPGPDVDVRFRRQQPAVDRR